MRIESGGSLRTWGQWVDQSRDMQPVKPLDSNVVGGPLDGERMPEGTREGLRYEWDGKRWRHVEIS